MIFCFNVCPVTNGLYWFTMQTYDPKPGAFWIWDEPEKVCDEPEELIDLKILVGRKMGGFCEKRKTKIGFHLKYYGLEKVINVAWCLGECLIQDIGPSATSPTFFFLKTDSGVVGS